jgi:putative tricarboxylic transport membrane protein
MGDIFQGGDQRAKVAAMVRSDVVAALVLVFSVTAAYESSKLPFGTIHKPGEGFFPFWISAVLFLLGLCLLFQALKSGPSTGREGSGRVAKVAVLLVVLAAYTFMLDLLGYPLCTFLLVLFMLRATEPQRWTVALSMAAITAVGSYVVFAIWLSVPLPRGPL